MIVLNQRTRGETSKPIFFYSLFCSYFTKAVNISGGHCKCLSDLVKEFFFFIDLLDSSVIINPLSITSSHWLCLPVPPKLHKKTDNVTGAMKLYVANEDKESFQEFSACQKLGRKGRCLKVEWVCHAAL